MTLPWTKQENDKIFVNYRRDDAGGFAGRLSDSLTSHFGSSRVFRDVTGIDYGQDFEQIIDQKIAEACAVIVLISDKWLSVADENGRARLFDPADYVAREIAAALESGIVVIPVLIGGATMPRKEELPEQLAGLSMRNAITISDERWAFDVARLAKVLAIDVAGSVTQGKLDMMRSIALAGLFAGIAFATVEFSFAVVEWAQGTASLKEAGFSPLVSALLFFGIILAGVMTLIATPMIEPTRRKYTWAATILATCGTTAPFINYALRNVELPSVSIVVNFAASIVVAAGMLVLISLAGFREK